MRRGLELSLEPFFAERYYPFLSLLELAFLDYFAAVLTICILAVSAGLYFLRKRRKAKKKPYWKRRKSYRYYDVVKDWAKEVAPEAKSLLDVGGGRAEYLNDFDWIRDRTVIDVKALNHVEGVNYIQGDFVNHDFGRTFELVFCLQVLEHLDHPEDFGPKLLESGEWVIISVPYKWSENKCDRHVQDPINIGKFLSWVPKDPVRTEVVKDKNARLVALFEGEAKAS